jgi:hypothetical protein
MMYERHKLLVFDEVEFVASGACHSDLYHM